MKGTAWATLSLFADHAVGYVAQLGGGAWEALLWDAVG